MKSYDTKGDFLKFEKMPVFKPNDEAFLQYLKKYKHDKNAKLALAYNLSKDLIRRQGGGRLEVFMTNFLRQIHILENQNSTIYQSNPHIGAGLLGGSVNGLEQDENGNLTFSPEKFALGFLGGAVGSKAVAQGFKYLKENPQVKEAVVKELADTLALGFEKAREKYPLLSLLEPRYMVQNQRGRSIQAKSMLKELEKEQRGLYNVVYNGKNATMIKQDLESVENAIRFAKGNKNKGAKHIAIEHLTDPNKEGYITDLELVNLGKSIRQYLAKYKEPFIDTNGARIYEWEKDGVRFRAVVNNIKGEGNSNLPQLSKPLNDDIITFYSDRNLKEKMNFKNPILKVQEKFKFNPQKAKDLLEWHKDSSPLTKDENGLPKVFYHGSKTKGFQVFRDYESGWGTFLSTHQKEAKFYKDAQKGSLIKSFIKLKNPFLMDTIRIENGKDYKEFALFLGLHKDDYGKNIGFNHFMRFERFKEYYNEIVETLAKHNLTLTEINPKHKIIRFVDKEGNYYNENMHKLSKKTRDIFNKNYFPISPRSVDFYDALGNEWIRNQADLALIAMQSASAREYAFYEVDRVYIKNFLKSKGHDGIRFNDYQFSVFDSNQIKHIDNKGAYSDGYDVWDKPSKKEIKENELEHKYFNESSPNIYQSNAHLGSGLLGGSVNGLEQDENGNLTFDPAKFVLGFLGGAVGSKAVAKGLEWRANKVAKSYPNIAKDNPALMQEIAKRDLQTYAMRNTHNALTRFLNKNKALDINPQLFAGEKALVNEAYAPHKARLERAKELESSGADEIEIWEKTGWYKDKDKKWKFEISQRGGEFDFSGLEFYTFSRDNRVKLSRILKDDELFTAYPSLKNLIVNFDYGMNDYKLGSYGTYTKEITLNAKQLRDNQSRLSTLYHEIQHAIQDIEGFGFGYKEAGKFKGNIARKCRKIRKATRRSGSKECAKKA